MKKRMLITILIVVLSLSFFSHFGYTYDSSDIEQFLIANRTLNGNPFRTDGEENIDQQFMVDLIQEEILNFNNLIDDYDNPIWFLAVVGENGEIIRYTAVSNHKANSIN